jgi:hypothetical protein
MVARLGHGRERRLRPPASRPAVGRLTMGERTIHDVLIAIAREPAAARLLADLGVDEDAIRAATKRQGSSEQPPEASATG